MLWPKRKKELNDIILEEGNYQATSTNSEGVAKFLGDLFTPADDKKKTRKRKIKSKANQKPTTKTKAKPRANTKTKGKTNTKTAGTKAKTKGKAKTKIEAEQGTHGDEPKGKGKGRTKTKTTTKEDTKTRKNRVVKKTNTFDDDLDDFEDIKKKNTNTQTKARPKKKEVAPHVKDDIKEVPKKGKRKAPEAQVTDKGEESIKRREPAAKKARTAKNVVDIENFEQKPLILKKPLLPKKEVPNTNQSNSPPPRTETTAKKSPITTTTSTRASITNICDSEEDAPRILQQPFKELSPPSDNEEMSEEDVNVSEREEDTRYDANPSPKLTREPSGNMENGSPPFTSTFTHKRLSLKIPPKISSLTDFLDENDQEVDSHPKQTTATTSTRNMFLLTLHSKK